MDSLKKAHKPKSQDRVTHNYEPMQPVAEQYKAPSKLHEQVVANLRKEKDYVASAYSNEKGNRIKLQEEITEKEYRLALQERELREIRLQNERLVDAERASIRQIEDLKARNMELSLDNESQMR